MQTDTLWFRLALSVPALWLASCGSSQSPENQANSLVANDTFIPEFPANVKRGWCWGAPLAKSAADNDWHHCGDYDTDNLTDDGSASIAPIDDGWIREKERAKSPLLQAYENAVEPIYQKIGLANVMLECGIRGTAWHQQTVGTLDAYTQQPQFEEMRGRLVADDANSAARFKQLVIDGTVSFHLGDDKASDCSRISNAPFVHNEAAFRP